MPLQALGDQFRAGLHTGECEFHGDDIGGIAVHIGPRLSALAGANDVLVSSTLRPGDWVKTRVRGSGRSQAQRSARRVACSPSRSLCSRWFRNRHLRLSYVV